MLLPHYYSMACTKLVKRLLKDRGRLVTARPHPHQGHRHSSTYRNLLGDVLVQNRQQVYSERRVVGYSCRQMFEVVAKVRQVPHSPS